VSKIELKEVSLVYTDAGKSFTALEEVSLKIREGEFVCLIGPSGCGKSTLISLVAGLSFPTRGEVLIDGERVRGGGANRGMVFQHYSLFPWLTAQKNVSFGIKQANLLKDKKLIEERALEFLGKVNLEEYAGKYPYQLSGGMRQRVAIARTLAMDADILLLDEPFGAVDPKNRMDLQDLTRKLCKENGNRKAVVFVTHDIDEALVLADRIVFMEPKKIREEIPAAFPPELSREGIMASPEFTRIRNRLMGLCLEDTGNRIGEGVTL
jgi:NitT/TauT family transport system ATP-binding protein